MSIATRRRREVRDAILLVAPFLIIFGVFFLYPTYKVIALSFTDAPLIGEGNWIGLDNYIKLFNDRLFYTSVWNNFYFVLLTVIPTTIIALLIALAVGKLKGRVQALVLTLFFLPYVLPVSVVTMIWRAPSASSTRHRAGTVNWPNGSCPPVIETAPLYRIL